MKTFQYVVFCVSAAFLYSCSSAVAEKNEVAEVKLAVAETGDVAHKAVTEALLTADFEQEQSEDTITDIRFKEFSVSISRLLIYDADKKLDQIQKDTVEIYAEVGELIEGQLISISSELFSDFKVEQRYQTSITIMNEGPHCDLIEWKHFYSEWKNLKAIKSGQFKGDKYSEKESEKFPKITMEELREAVREHCSEDWVMLLDNATKPTEYPSAVAISRYFLRITGKRKVDGQMVTKIIIIETPMGC